MATSFSKSSYWQMILAAFTFSLVDILLKPLSLSFPTPGIALFRFLVGGLILGTIISWRGGSLKGNNLLMLLARGITGTLSFLCLIKSISMIPLPNAIVLFYTAPLFVVPLSFFFLREPVGKIEVVLIALGFLGIYILVNPRSHALNMGYILALLSGCIGAMATVLIRKLRQTDGPLIIYFYFCLVGTALSFPFAAGDLTPPNPQQFTSLIAIALLLLIAQPLMNHAFKYCKASEGSVVLMSELVFTSVAGFLLFRAPVTLNFLAGSAMIVGSGVGLNLMNRRVRQSEVSMKA